MKIAYFGIDLFADCLLWLINEGFEVAEIFTFSSDPYDSVKKITKIAKEYNIPITEKRVKTEDILRLEKTGVKLTVTAGYGAKIPLSDKILQINIHPSLLPVGRGAWPMPCNILRNTESGVTIHKLAEGFDTGDIILQEKISLSDRENLETLTAKIQKTAIELLKKFMQNPLPLFGKATPQGEGEYWHEPDDSDRSISPDDTVEKADLLLRAFYGYGILYKGDVEIPYGEAVTEKSEKGEYLSLKNGYIRIKS